MFFKNVFEVGKKSWRPGVKRVTDPVSARNKIHGNIIVAFFVDLCYKLGQSYVTRSEKRDLLGKSEILHDERLKKSWVRGDGAEDKSKWGIWPPLLTVRLCFPTLFSLSFSYSSSGFIYSRTVFCHNLVTRKHVATSTLNLWSIELRAGDAASSGGSGARRKRVEASSCRSARVCTCRAFFNNWCLLK